MDYRPILQRVIYRIEYNLEDDINRTQLSELAHLSAYPLRHLSTLLYFVGNTTIAEDAFTCQTWSALPGDVNGDGIVNVLDITWIARIILGME